MAFHMSCGFNDCRFTSPGVNIERKCREMTKLDPPQLDCCCCCETHNAHALRAPKHEGRLTCGCCKRSSTPKASAFRLASVAFASEMAFPSRFPHKGANRR